MTSDSMVEQKPENSRSKDLINLKERIYANKYVTKNQRILQKSTNREQILDRFQYNDVETMKIQYEDFPEELKVKMIFLYHQKTDYF